ncbi:hypothetical protein ACLB2K_013460 [Fragaria x ananassa]
MKLFQRFISQADLSDLGFQGPRFTWFCIQKGRVRIKERLDRGFANPAWSASFPLSQVMHLPKLASDHRPILLDTNPSGSSMPRIFRFEYLWISHPHCYEIVRKNWNSEFLGSAWAGWLRNLSRCKYALNEWSKDVFPNFGNKVTENIMHIQTLLEDEKEDIGQLLSLKTDQIASYWAMEEMFWKQRSCISWLAHGDMNTHFFHQTTTSNRRRNKILQIKDDNGNWITTEPEIVAHLTEYFENMYTATDLSNVEEVLSFVENKVTLEINESLMLDVTMEEVKAAVFDLGALKAPGPDGFSGSFYQAHWEIVKEIIVSATSQTWTSAKMSPHFNCNYLALIPKVDNPEVAAQFRPIALYNFGYKILTKIISNRLKLFMPDLITENQSAFVSGR